MVTKVTPIEREDFKICSFRKTKITWKDRKKGLEIPFHCATWSYLSYAREVMDILPDPPSSFHSQICIGLLLWLPWDLAEGPHAHTPQPVSNLILLRTQGSGTGVWRVPRFQGFQAFILNSKAGPSTTQGVGCEICWNSTSWVKEATVGLPGTWIPRVTLLLWENISTFQSDLSKFWGHLHS